MKPDISIIIPAYNEENYIATTLESIHKSAFLGTYEVIVVCNGCTDSTARIAEGMGARVFTMSAKGAPEAMNYGAQQAKADILAFLDADTTMSSHLLRDVLDARMRGYVGGRTVVRWSGESLVAKMSRIVSYVHKHKWGGFCFLDRELFNKIGGYATGAKYGFDFDLSHRAQREGKSAFLRKSYVVTSNRRFEKEGWLKHLWLASKRYYIDERLLRAGVKHGKHIEYEDYR